MTAERWSATPIWELALGAQIAVEASAEARYVLFSDVTRLWLGRCENLCGLSENWRFAPVLYDSAFRPASRSAHSFWITDQERFGAVFGLDTTLEVIWDGMATPIHSKP